MGQSVSAKTSWMAAAVVAALLGGCASQELDQSQVTAPTGSRPSSGVVMPAQATLGGARLAEYRSTSDDVRMVIRREEAATGKDWTVTRSEAHGAGEAAVASELVFRMEREDQVLVQTTEHADDVVTEMKPPMLVFPASLEAGKAVKREFRMIVHPAGNPKAVKNEGPASNELVYEADETIAVPAGTFETRKVRSTLRAELGKAKVENITESWYAAPPGPGLVAERERQRVTVFGVPVRVSDRMWVLEKWEGAAAAPKR